MEHIEEAGIHSGDSACVIPPYTLGEDIQNVIRDATTRLALGLNVIGLINIQFAVKDETVYVLEVNPRASRTVPFVSKTVGLPLAKIAARVMAGSSLAEVGPLPLPKLDYMAIKEAVLPFGRFPGVDTVLGPEMRSTGEVMGLAEDFGVAYAKSQLASGFELPLDGRIFISVCNRDKRSIIFIAQELVNLGYNLVSTAGTAEVVRRAGIVVEEVAKVHEGRPNVVDMIINREVGLVINTPWGRGPRSDGYHIRTACAAHGVACITTLAAASAVVQGLKAVKRGEIGVRALQEYHRPDITETLGETVNLK